MSKISVGATNQDVVSQIKDQYAMRERESETRHKDDIRELREVHRGEIEQLRMESQKRVQDLEEDNSVKLNKKDVQFQKEIEALKAIYAKRVSEGKKPTEEG